MCGITAIFNVHEGTAALRKQVLEMSKRIRHRGPDWSGVYQGKTAILAHERLSIVDPASGGQPLVSPDGKQILCVNGEIYNHRELRERLKDKYEFQTGSDCEVILALYREKGIHFIEDLNGIFAFALYDEEKDVYLIARDAIGVIPLYIGYDDAGHLMVSSELKGLEGFASRYEPFLPGHYFYSEDNALTRWYERDWMDYDNVKENPADPRTLHDALEAAVRRQLMSDVIYHIETYDVTTVRASTPMYLLARVIKSMGIKMVLSGEGADEVFGGYLYFHKAPDARAFHEETLRKLSKLHLYDCLRANKSLAAWGVEGRVPFLDKEFLDVAMRLNPAAKMCPGRTIEKKILREAFTDMLPEEIVWRQKEQFSDGVGYGWIDTLKRITAEAVSDDEMARAAERFPINPPRNKEEYYYRSLFEEHFPSESAAHSVPSVPSVACSTAEALAWDAAFQNMNEPSGRAVKGVHEAAY